MMRIFSQENDPSTNKQEVKIVRVELPGSYSLRVERVLVLCYYFCIYSV